MTPRLPLLAVFSTFLLLGAARAWDPYGHMLVGHTAYGLLDPKAKAAVDELATQVKHPKWDYDFVTLGCWMDDIRDDDPSIPFSGQFKPWHYITWGHEPSDADPPLEPGPGKEARAGNVIIGLKRAQAVLEGGRDPEIPDRAHALAILVHLTGDVHQPLHCASHFHPNPAGKIVNDRGGNAVLIDNAPALELPGGKTVPMNLHAFWDAAYRAQFDQAAGRLVVDQRYSDYTVKDMDLLRPLTLQLPAVPPGEAVAEPGDFVAWGRASNALAVNPAYAKLPRFEKNRFADVDAAYTEEAGQLARAQLVLAGRRLADLLNRILGEGAAPAAR